MQGIQTRNRYMSKESLRNSLLILREANIWLIAIVCSMTFFGCKAYEQFKDKQEIKKQVTEILNTPNLTNENTN